MHSVHARPVASLPSWFVRMTLNRLENGAMPLDPPAWKVVLSDSGLQSLLHDIGGGLVTLRLFGCRTISDEGVRAIAQSCPNLRELDLG